MKKFFLSFFVLVFGVLNCSSSLSESLSFSQAVDIAGQQRMLSQRIMASYLLLGINKDSDQAKRQLNRSIEKFDKNISDLSVFEPANKVLQELNTVRVIWIPFKALVQSFPNKNEAKNLLVDADLLLEAANRYVESLQKLSASNESDSRTAELVNIAGRQRMLSQRMAKNYFAYYWGVGDESNIKRLYEDLAEYESVLGYLESNSSNSAEINAKVHKVQGQLAYVSKGFDGLMKISGDRLIYVVTGTTNSMLKNMDDLTKMYAEL